jgi:hypothetical protein
VPRLSVLRFDREYNTCLFLYAYIWMWTRRRRNWIELNLETRWRLQIDILTDTPGWLCVSSSHLEGVKPLVAAGTIVAGGTSYPVLPTFPSTVLAYCYYPLNPY